MSLRTRIGHLLARACKAYVARKQLEPRIIGRRLAKNYLLRYYPYGRRSHFGERPEEKKPGPINAFIHHFQDSDMDHELHSHPWKWGLAIVLSGGYREERVHDPLTVQSNGVKPLVRTHTYLPLSINFLEAKDFHRIDLLEGDAWTLFLAGPERDNWGFWDRNTGVFRLAED